MFKSRYLMTIIGVGIGALIGYLYFVFAGCESGCAITSKPLNSSLYGALVGGLLLSSFKKERKNNNE